jgi:hypothetical protein
MPSIFCALVILSTLNGNYLCITLLSKSVIFLCRYNIDTHDYDVRLRAAKKFLKDGDKVGTCYVNFYFSASISQNNFLKPF